MSEILCQDKAKASRRAQAAALITTGEVLAAHNRPATWSASWSISPTTSPTASGRQMIS